MVPDTINRLEETTVSKVKYEVLSLVQPDGVAGQDPEQEWVWPISGDIALSICVKEYGSPAQ